MVRFSIIIPTRNRPHRLDRCLAAIAALSYSKTAYEVIVVDDGSSAPPDEILARHAESIQLVPLRQGRHGPAQARNLGLCSARGEYVVFTDDDCRPLPNWLDSFEAAVWEQPKAAFGGAVRDGGETGMFASASQMLVTYLYEYAQTHPTRLRFYCTNNMAFPRERLLDLGGFDEGFPLAAAEDRDLCDRWSRQHKLLYAEDAVVLHDQDLTFAGFCRQQFRYGRGALHFTIRRRQRGLRGVHIEPYGFYFGMLAYPARKLGFLRGLPLSALLVVSQAANAAGYFRERWRSA